MLSNLYEFGTNPYLANCLCLFLKSCHGCDNSCGYHQGYCKYIEVFLTLKYCEVSKLKQLISSLLTSTLRVSLLLTLTYFC